MYTYALCKLSELNTKLQNILSTHPFSQHLRLSLHRPHLHIYLHPHPHIPTYTHTDMHVYHITHLWLRRIFELLFEPDVERIEQRRLSLQALLLGCCELHANVWRIGKSSTTRGNTTQHDTTQHDMTCNTTRTTCLMTTT